jgi:membrane associated rhomboid family serine protease
VLALTAALVAAFLWQLNAPKTDAAILRHGLVPARLSDGAWPGLFSHIFLHGGWAHLILNATALLAFGTPVARLFGSGAAGALRFLLFFLACGVLGGLTFWALHPGGETPLVGASGAISGLMGGAARLFERPGRLGAPFGRAALSFVVPWVVMNLLIAAAGLALGPALPIAWQAHLGGLAAGLFAVGLFAPRALIRGRD